MRCISKIIYTICLFFTTSSYGDFGKIFLSKDIAMKSFSLGRIDISIPSDFSFTGRTQTIYHVDASTIPLTNNTGSEIWTNRLDEIKQEHIKAGNNHDSIEVQHTSSGLKVVFYNANPGYPDQTFLEAQQDLGDHILSLKYQGKSEKQENMLKLVSIVSDSYTQDIPYGFNIGRGSITSKPSRNEHASAGFVAKTNNIELFITTQTSGKYLSDHPLEDIDHEIEALSKEGVTLKVLKNYKKTIEGFEGYEGRIFVESQSEEPIFRFTWFYSGITADSFNPEILIKATGPKKHMDTFNHAWDEIIESLKMRPENSTTMD